MRLCLLALALLWPAGAWAHGLSPAISGFYAGGAIVLIGPDDVLQWLALCAFAAVHAPARAGWVAEALTMGLLAGFAVGTAGLAGAVPLWAADLGLLAVGALLVSGVRVPFIALAGLAAGIGALRGAHDGLDMAGRADTLSLAAGIGITAYLFMVVGIATLSWLMPRITPLRLAFRAFGSWVVAIALMLGASEFIGHGMHLAAR